MSPWAVVLALQGLAHCFERGEDGGKLQDVFVIEPVSANSLECMVAGECLGIAEESLADDDTTTCTTSDQHIECSAHRTAARIVVIIR